MTMLHTKKRAISVVLLVTILCVPQVSYAQWDGGFAAEVFGATLRKIAKNLDEIQKAVILVVLVHSIMTQIDQIVDSAGGAIVGTAGWLALMDKIESDARIETQNQLAYTTRGACLNKNEVSGNQDSIQKRVCAFIQDGVNGGSKIQNTSIGDYLRNNAGTVSDVTGKSESNISALTDTFNPEKNIMAWQIARDLRAENEKRLSEAEKWKRTASPYNSAQPTQTAADVNSVRQSAFASILNGNLLSKAGGPVLITAANRLLKNLGGKAEDAVGKKIQGVKNDLKKTFNKIGGSKEFEKSY